MVSEGPFAPECTSGADCPKDEVMVLAGWDSSSGACVTAHQILPPWAQVQAQTMR